MDWRGKKILVMGLGLLGGGVGTARYFLERGADVTITDLRDEETLRPSLAQLKIFSFRGVFGRHEEKDFQNAELVVRNPGVPDSSPFLTIARNARVPVETEASILMSQSRAFVLGVTGTKGKTTTSQLLTEVLRAQGAEVFLTGLPGTSFLKTLGETEGRAGAVIVGEFSSWDLESIVPHRISPPVALITNLFPDHLNRHGTMEAYLEAKAAIFEYQHKDDVIVVPESERTLCERAKKSPGRLCLVPEQEIDAMPRMLVPGRHARRSAALALTAAQEAIGHVRWPFSLLRFSQEKAFNAVRSFPGVEGRLQTVAVCKGRSFVNDTAATNPGAVEAALDALAGPLVLIAGGEDKGLPYTALAERIAGRVKHIVLFPGSASEKLEHGLHDAGFTAISSKVDGMKEAVLAAWDASNAGDTILLSPAAASFNQFRNEFDRGEQFVDAVKKLCSFRR